MKKLLIFCLMLLGAVAQAQNFAITATTEAAVRKNIVKGNAANYGFGVINDTLKLIGLTTRNVIFTSQINKGVIGLGNVDNTSDANKPVSTATQTALNLKANIASPTFTGTVAGITKSMVGLGSVDNTTDVGKPVSTATQTALDLKLTSTTAASTYLPIANPTATGTLTAPTIANTLGANFATTSGNVGIGTTSPASKLHVYDNSGGVGNTTIRLESLAGGYGAGVEAGSNLTGTSTYLSMGKAVWDGEAAWNSTATTQDSYFTIHTAQDGTVSEKMRVTSGGNVGIGTTSVTSKITVGTGSTNERMYFRGTIGDLEMGTGTSGIKIGTPNNTNVFFTTNDANRLNIFANGRVGINTTTDAGYLLDVNGTLRTVNDAYFATTSGNVGIGTSTPNTSSILDIASTTKGVLFPRLTTTQINDIASPADGLTVYNTTLKVICFYDSSAAGWKKVSHSNM